MSTLTPELLKRNQALKEQFFEARKIEKEYQIPSYDKLHGFIYCIENKNTGKKYIGSTYSVWTDIKNPHPLSALHKRASHYIYEYNSAMKSLPSIKPISRPIIRAMVDEGIENFVMYPVAETTDKSHNSAEHFFIDKYKTDVDGYNVVAVNPNRTTNAGNTKGRVLTKHDKLIRSEPILAINMNSQEIVTADSMKLLADFLNTSKDIIKNNARSGRNHRGWFIFYNDSDKRHHILHHFVLGDNLGIQKRGNSRNHSDKSKQFYQELFNNVDSYLKNPKSELFANFTKLPDLCY